ncbi:MAG: glycosyltransferase family 39 protein [Candidatus Moraniibacteriota bacterium]
MWFFKTADRREVIALATLATMFNMNCFLFILKFIPHVPKIALLSDRNFFLISLPISSLLLLAGIFFFNPFHKVRDWSSKLLLFLFPTVIVFAIVWNRGDLIPDSAKIFVCFSVLFIGAYYAVRVIGKRSDMLHSPSIEEPSPSRWVRNQGFSRLATVIALTAVFFGFAIRDLGTFAAVDEALWLYGRIPKYWNAFASLEPAKTNISDKPGITVALTTGFGLLSENNPKAWKDLEGNYRHIDDFFRLFRLPIVVLATLLLPLFYYLLERLSGKTSALFAYSFIALSPVTIGMTKIINPDSLLWLFAPLSLFAYLAYVKRRHLGFLLLSGGLLGLALLTKYVANILFVFVLGIIFLEYVFRKEEEPFLVYLKRSLLAYAVWTFTAISVFFVLFPATWVKPVKILNATIFSQAFEKVTYLFIALFAIILADSLLNRSRFTGAIAGFLRRRYRFVALSIGIIWTMFFLFVTTDVWTGMKPYDFMTILAAPKTVLKGANIFGVFASNAYPLVFGVTPFVFFLLIAASFIAIRKRHLRTAAGKFVFFGVLFIMLYYAGTTISKVGAITRYQIMLFPIAGAIAGISLSLFLKTLLKSSVGNQPWSAKLIPTILAVIIVSGLTTLFMTPFPLSYASVLLPRQYGLDVKDMGEGSYEAAQYLNSFPDAYKLVIWSDKDGVCKFFNGVCKSGFDWSAYSKIHLDYYVVTSGRESRTGKFVGSAVRSARSDTIRLDEFYDRTDPQWELLINDRPSQFIKIFPNTQ